MTTELPKQRVFRPASDNMNMLINKLMKIHEKQGDIPRGGWTEYVSFLLNKDLQEITQNAQRRIQP